MAKSNMWTSVSAPEFVNPYTQANQTLNNLQKSLTSMVAADTQEQQFAQQQAMRLSEMLMRDAVDQRQLELTAERNRDLATNQRGTLDAILARDTWAKSPDNPANKLALAQAEEYRPIPNSIFGSSTDATSVSGLTNTPDSNPTLPFAKPSLNLITPDAQLPKDPASALQLMLDDFLKNPEALTASTAKDIDKANKDSATQYLEQLNRSNTGSAQTTNTVASNPSESSFSFDPVELNNQSPTQLSALKAKLLQNNADRVGRSAELKDIYVREQLVADNAAYKQSYGSNISQKKYLERKKFHEDAWDKDQKAQEAAYKTQLAQLTAAQESAKPTREATQKIETAILSGNPAEMHKSGIDQITGWESANPWGQTGKQKAVRSINRLYNFAQENDIPLLDMQKGINLGLAALVDNESMYPDYHIDPIIDAIWSTLSKSNNLPTRAKKITRNELKSLMVRD